MSTAHTERGNPFDLDDNDAYQRWREARLAAAPRDIEELIVEVRDPRRLTDAEQSALLACCQRANMAIYAGATGDDPSREIPVAIGARLGLRRLDHNPGAEEDAVTALTVQTDALHQGYIPYSNRPLSWHTDGYYNAPARQVHGLLMHCVRPAREGGRNALLDHEIAYILIRDEDPAHIRALMQPACLTIPADPGSETAGRAARPVSTGPVFSVDRHGELHMRYTDRGRNIVWADDPATRAAVACLKRLLSRETPWHLSARLGSGWGLVCNNVLHTRTGFTDGPEPRLIYRARYYDRVGRA